MADHVLDTNVLLVASAVHPASPFDDSDLPAELLERVLYWLGDFRADTGRHLVLDELFKIYDEYRNKLTDQDYGLMVINEKMQHACFVDVKYANGHAVVPPAFAAFDPSDRKFLAAHLCDVANSTLVNATDTDWLEIEPELSEAGACVEHLLEPWLRGKFAEKHSA